MRITKLVPVGLVALGVAAAPAYAQQNATLDAYSSMPISVPPSSAVKGAAATKGPSAEGPSAANLPTAPSRAAQPTPAVTSPSGSLPFTGLDVGIVAALAALLLGLGFALRRTTRTSNG